MIEDLANPDEATLDLAAGTVSAAVALAGTTDPVIGPTDVEIQEGVNTILYAWGSAEDGNLAIAAQTITGLHSNPDGVPSGTAGYLAQQDASVVTLVSAGVIALAIAAAVGSAVVVRRRQSVR